MKKTIFLSISFLGAYSYCSEDNAKNVPLLDRTAASSSSLSSAANAAISLELDIIDEKKNPWNSDDKLCFMYAANIRKQRADMMSKARESDKLAYNNMLGQNILIAMENNGGNRLDQLQVAGREGAKIGNTRVYIFYTLAVAAFLMGLLYKFAIPTPAWLK